MTVSNSLFKLIPEYNRHTLLLNIPPNHDTVKALAQINALSPSEKAALVKGMAIAISSPEAEPELKQASVAAAVAAEHIEGMFVDLTARISALGHDTESLMVEFTIIKDKYRVAVKESRTMAVTVSQYASSFDDIIIKFCRDDKIPVEERLQKINAYIAKSENIKQEANVMHSKFTSMKDRFAEFVAMFSFWAKEREQGNRQEVDRIYKELERIDEELRKINIAFMALTATLAATLPITGIIAAFIPVFAPFIMAAGSIIAGAQIAAVTGLAIAREQLMRERRNNEAKIKELEADIDKIMAVRTQLDKYGQTSLTDFKNNIDIMQNVWVRVVNDAEEVKLWLLGGASYVNYPEYMRMSLEQSVITYKRMGGYLKGYADGVTRLAMN